jgi:hypothetical protein
MWGCCYVSMFKKVPYQNMLELKSGERVIFSIMLITGCPTKDHDCNWKRGLKISNSLEHFNLMLLQLFC